MNSALKHQPDWSCELGWTPRAWDDRICADLRVPVSSCWLCEQSLGRAVSVKPADLLLYFIYSDRAKGMIHFSKSSTFYSLTVVISHPQHKREVPRRRRLGKSTGSVYRASPQNAGARKGQGVSRDGISKGHQEGQILFCGRRSLLTGLRNLPSLYFL